MSRITPLIASLIVLLAVGIGAELTQSPQAEAQSTYPGMDGCWGYEHNHNGWASRHVHQTHRVYVERSDGTTFSHCVDTNPHNHNYPNEPPPPTTTAAPHIHDYGTPTYYPLDRSSCDAPTITGSSAGLSYVSVDWERSDTRCQYHVQYAYYKIDESGCGELLVWRDCESFEVDDLLQVRSLLTNGGEDNSINAGLPRHYRVAAVRVRSTNGATGAWSGWDYLGNAEDGNLQNYCQTSGGIGGTHTYQASTCANASHLEPSAVEADLTEAGLVPADD